MKKNLQFSVFVFCLVLSSLFQINAQTNEWQPIFLQVTGVNTLDGVEASFQINTCNGEDIIYIKFINHNANAVKLEWFDGVFTQELKWINKELPVDKKSLILTANKEVKGECMSKLYPELMVKMEDFVADKKDFKRYSTSHLRVIAVQ